MRRRSNFSSYYLKKFWIMSDTPLSTESTNCLIYPGHKTKKNYHKNFSKTVVSYKHISAIYLPLPYQYCIVIVKFLWIFFKFYGQKCIPVIKYIA